MREYSFLYSPLLKKGTYKKYLINQKSSQVIAEPAIIGGRKVDYLPDIILGSCPPKCLSHMPHCLTFPSSYQIKVSFHKEKQIFKKQTSVTGLGKNNSLSINILELGKNRNKGIVHSLSLTVNLNKSIVFPSFLFKFSPNSGFHYLSVLFCFSLVF